jgi:protein-export chaperone SecB
MTNLWFSQSDPILKVDKLYVKDLICKVPNSAYLFGTSKFKELLTCIVPSLGVITKIQSISQIKYEVTLHAILDLQAKNINLLNLQVQQSGIFTLNILQIQVKSVLENHCVELIQPYLSQTIYHTMTQAGFPPIILQAKSSLKSSKKDLEIKNFLNKELLSKDKFKIN